MNLFNLCGPVILYLGFSLIQIIIDIFKKHYNVALLKFIVMIIFGTVLNIMCSKKLTIISEGIEGPFNSILTKWSFDEADNGVLVNVNISLDLKNKIFEKILKRNIKKIISQVVTSFEERADILY